MSEMTPESFPLVRGVIRSTRSFDKALAVILDGEAAGSIRNVELKEAKETLSRAVYEAWPILVSQPWIYGRLDDMSQDLKDLYYSILVMGLHDVISTSKKVAKTKAEGPAVDAMRAFCDEILPLSLLVASLKGKVTMGRAPSTGPAKPENPNKKVRTCPVCMRGIAERGTMVHHGSTRPGHGFQTGSCAGIQFQPLEVSPKGLEFVVRSLSHTLATSLEAIAQQATKPEYLLGRRERKGPVEKIYRDDPLWKRLFDAYVSEKEFTIRSIKADLPALEKMLAEWAPGCGGRADGKPT